MALESLRKILEETTGRVGEIVDEYEQEPSPSAGALRPFFDLSSQKANKASPELEAFLARTGAMKDRREAERAVEAASKFPSVRAREDVPQEGVPESLRPSSSSDWVTARPMSSNLSQPKTDGRPLENLGVVPEPAMGQAPSYTLEDLPVQDYPRAPVAPLYELEDVAQGPTPEATAKIAKRNVSLTSPIPTASAPVTKDAAAPVASVVPSTGPQTPAGKPDSMGAPGLPAPSSEGAGGDVLGRLGLGQALVRALEGSGSVIAGRDLRSGAADTLGERMKQIEALRAKREERQEGLAVERSQNEQTLNAYQAQFPELREALEPLRGQTGKPAFQGLLRDIVATRKAKTSERALDLREQGMQDMVEFRTGTLGLRKDTLEEKKRYNDIQAGLKQAELNLRAAENERKATGSAEPSDKERSAFQASMKPAENTAVSLKDADNLNLLSTGMLVSGKPPPFLTQADIVSFVGIPPFEGAMRSRLAQSNPQAFDLLTQMARLKTMVGHEYFGSALSPAEAERQRQFLDFGMTDTPDSIARKMKSYRDTLADKATIFLRPRVVGRSLGADWAQATGLDALSAPGGTFAGLLDAPKGAVSKSPTASGGDPAATPAPAAPAAPAVERVIMLNPAGEKRAVRADQVEKAKAQGWRMP